MYNYKNISIQRLGHDGFLVLYKGKNICIDPFEIKENFEADYLFLTHNHKDHTSLNDINKIIKSDTIVICPPICEENIKDIPNKKIFINPNENLTLDDFSLKTLPAYNTNKFRSPGIQYHPKESGFLGYILDFDGTKIYHAGDTDIIPEMENIYPDIALLPVSGVYAMTAQEAVQAIELIKPKIAIPMHYDSIVGTIEDAKYFEKHTQCEVVIL
ncbi:MBL fold metallo-hydrolase [Candidatus Gracilibacteria bacterium]|nr:MBL fold metallo-hydrolase [Candidatus Gracilibacteria bacterium]